LDTPFPLLSTKLFVPPPRPTLIPRPRLVERLSQGLALPLTLISAPAGFGKTTLISEWRASNAGRDYPLACLSLETDDNDPTRFLTYLVAALGTLKSDLAETALGMLQSPQPPPVQAFLTGLINDLGELDHPFALVLDDYHVINAKPVHEALGFLLDHLPRHMHLVLLTRADPPLPLARMRARDQLVEIRADDLRFTSIESAAFFNQVAGLALSDDDAMALEERTEGWVAGLQLAALAMHTPHSMQRSEDIARFIAAFTGSHYYVADYLASEVLNRQPEAVRSFLLQTSILGRMTGELCDCLTGQRDGQAMLRQLETSNLFLIPLDAERRWYRYHHLFADVLRTQLQQAYPDQLAELHQRAAEWYEQNGFVPEAVHHALAAGDQLFVARLMENNAMAMLMRGEAVTVLSWITTIAPLVGEHPWLAIYQSWAFICTGQLDQLEHVLQIPDQHLSLPVMDAEAEDMRSHVAVIRALATARRGEAQQAITQAQKALDLLPEGDTIIRGTLVFTLGDAYWQTGDLVGARRAFAEASRINKAVGNFLAGVLALSSLAALLTEQGELRRAAEIYQAAVQMATRSDRRMMPAAAQACLGLAGLAYEWNELDAAGRDVMQALELGHRWGNPDTMANTHLVQARLQQAQGDTTAAFESLRQAEGLAQGPGVTGVTALRIEALRVRLWLAQANREAVTRWSREQPFDLHGEISYQSQITYLTQTRILIAQNQADKATTLLARLLEQVEAHEQMGRALEVLILQSLALADSGDTAGALTTLARALMLGQSEGYVRVFLDEGAPMAELLRHAGSHGISSKYVAELLSQFDGEIGFTPDTQQPLIEPLTERELEVLRLLAEGLSNQEIANELVVALGTAKTHTASLYRKLDVASRTQAVARARELGLL
jgi:LuxR family maltose regulon positive regulatory protein